MIRLTLSSLPSIDSARSCVKWHGQSYLLHFLGAPLPPHGIEDSENESGPMNKLVQSDFIGRERNCVAKRLAKLRMVG